MTQLLVEEVRGTPHGRSRALDQLAQLLLTYVLRWLDALATSQREGAALVVKVLDVGIAKVVTEAITSAIGSPLWMAPEQTTPKAHRARDRCVAPRADGVPDADGEALLGRREHRRCPPFVKRGCAFAQAKRA